HQSSCRARGQPRLERVNANASSVLLPAPPGCAWATGTLTKSNPGDLIRLAESDMPMSRSSSRNVTEGFLVLGTALTVYWQPLARQLPAKPSHVVLVLALGAWLVSLLRQGLPPTLKAAGFRLFLPPLAFLGSLLAATLAGYLRYDLVMSRDGIILLA